MTARIHTTLKRGRRADCFIDPVRSIPRSSTTSLPCFLLIAFSSVAFQDEDVEHLYAMRNDYRVQRFVNLEPNIPYPTKYKEFLKTQAEGSTIWFSIILKATGEFVGQASIKVSEPKNRDGMFGISTYPKFWGNGYGTEASKFMIGHAFEALGVQRVSLTVLDGNEPAIAVYKKLGFKHEGTKRRANWAEGHWEDLLYMGILEEEWAALHKGNLRSTS